jgi:diaminohydroxyphosphoribosylaminopyrimidine deaminase/5-amino-6-(5-phosphoribosylamino)uracil reductase
MSGKHESFMRACFLLAAKGYNKVKTNPLVGCTIVYNDSIIASGWHQEYGKAHAEINALHQITDTKILKESTLYVNLEPCSHYGKTPPCADAIIQHKIPRVVISNTDPFEKVAGKGIARLEHAGITVIQNVLQQEGYYVNRAFFTYIQEKRPYITLKWAESADNFIAPVYPRKFLISGAETHTHTQKLRAYSDAILIGKNTLWADNPKLTVREIPEALSPVRLIVSSNVSVPQNAFVCDKQASTWYMYPAAHGNFTPFSNGFHYIPLQNTQIPTILDFLYQKGIKSVLVEGGTDVLKQFISQNLYDEIWVYQSKKINLKQGLPAPVIHENLNLYQETESDNILQYSKIPLYRDFWN